MRYLVLYGLVGDWIVAQFKARNVFGILIAFCIIVLGAIVCEWILSDLKKKGENLLYIGAVCGYVLSYGLITLAVSSVFYFLVLVVEALGDICKIIEPELFEETNEERKELLWEELFYSNVILRCLDYHHQQVYKYELDNLFNDDSCTVEEAQEKIRKWYVYVDEPMKGSEKWKELHSED